MDWKPSLPQLPHISFDPQQRIRDLLALLPLDLSYLPDLQQACWPDLSIIDVQNLVNEVLARHRRGYAWGMVASVKDQIVGFGQLARWGSKTAEISDLVVAAAWRGKGIGTAIITDLIEIARRQGFSSVEIGAAESNPVALSLYQRLGFEEYKRVLIDLGHGLEHVVYLRYALKPRRQGE
jgi:ribosomal protein S18 acetylase RimI-like enzyme